MSEDIQELEFRHTPVLLNEVIDNMQLKSGGIYVDGTLGGGGHAYEALSRTKGNIKYIGIDQDADAIKAASKRLSAFSASVIIVRDNYCNIKNILKDLNIDKVNGIIIDLGVSSYQLDAPKRGFSYRENALLDMRMDDRQELTARDIINNYSEMELYRIIRDYGEDKFAKNIAKHIVMARKDKQIETTFELNEVIKAAIPAKLRTNGHPSKQTFQAIRIELNKELEILSNTLEDMINLLDEGGRLCIITFHSLEDRIVKTNFKNNENPCICPPDFPICVCGKKSKGINITKKPIFPSKEELFNNPRSKSAKLRVFEKHTAK